MIHGVINYTLTECKNDLSRETRSYGVYCQYFVHFIWKKLSTRRLEDKTAKTKHQKGWKLRTHFFHALNITHQDMSSNHTYDTQLIHITIRLNITKLMNKYADNTYF